MLPVDTIRALVDQNMAAYTAFTTLSPYGTVYVVGGAVRDVFLGKEPKDIDLLVAGIDAESIKGLLEASGGHVQPTGVLKKDNKGEVVEGPTGKAMGIFLFRMGGDHVEIALPRVEWSTGEGHKDFEVQHDPNIPIEVDLGRRDFTANSMAINLNTGELIDPYNGQVDILNNQLRLVNEHAFSEDPLRIVRAVVAYARHGLIPDSQTEEAMTENADKIRNLPGIRIQLELDKLLGAPDPASALEIAASTGVLDYILPEVSSALGFDQHNEHHDLPVGEHLLASLRAMSQLSDDVDLRLAALLHDIGKPDSFWMDEEGKGHFYENGELGANHEEVGAEMARQLMRRLDYPNSRINRVVGLINNHMFDYFISEKGARKHLNNLGGDYDMAWDLQKLRQADASGKKNGEVPPEDYLYLQQGNTHLQTVIDKANAVTRSNLAINGQDIINLGVPQGEEVGRILNELLQLVIEEPDLNNREELLMLAQGLIRNE